MEVSHYNYMSTITNERLSMYHLDRTRRKKYEGRSQKWCGTTRTVETRISITIKKGEDQGKEKCHTKSMMSNEPNKSQKDTLNSSSLFPPE